jgi:hypothetical protein
MGAKIAVTRRYVKTLQYFILYLFPKDYYLLHSLFCLVVVSLSARMRQLYTHLSLCDKRTCLQVHISKPFLNSFLKASLSYNTQI